MSDLLDRQGNPLKAKMEEVDALNSIIEKLYNGKIG